MAGLDKSISIVSRIWSQRSLNSKWFVERKRDYSVEQRRFDGAESAASKRSIRARRVARFCMAHAESYCANLGSHDDHFWFVPIDTASCLKKSAGLPCYQAMEGRAAKAFCRFVPRSLQPVLAAMFINGRSVCIIWSFRGVDD